VADDVRFRYAEIPLFAFPEFCPKMTASVLLTYSGIRTFTYRKTAANEGYNDCIASLETLGKRTGQSRSVLEKNIAWLEKHDLVYRIPQGWNMPKRIRIVVNPYAFREKRLEAGREAAIDEADANREEEQHEARVEAARDAMPRREAQSSARRRNAVPTSREWSPEIRERGPEKNDRGPEIGICGPDSGTVTTGITTSGFNIRKETSGDKDNVIGHPSDDALSANPISQSQKPEEQTHPSEGGLVPASKELLNSIRSAAGYAQSKSGGGFVAEPFDTDAFKRIRAECEARDRAPRQRRSPLEESKSSE